MATQPNFRPDDRSADSLPTAAPPNSPVNGRGLLVAASIAVLTWCYWPTLAGLVQTWESSPDYSHGFLVVPLAAWFLWRRRDTLPRSSIAPSWGGLVLLVLAALTRLAAARFYLPELDGLSIPLCLAGACWLFGGAALLRWAAPSLAFLLFMVPLPASVDTLLSGPLQTLGTAMSTWTLQSLGQPAIAEGTTILLNDHVLEVERACSGLRMFYGILALAVAYLIVSRARLKVAVLLLASVAPVAILANVIRITLTGFLYEFASSEAARRFSHDFAGLLMIVLAVALFGAVLWVIDRAMRQFRRSRAAALQWTALGLAAVAALLPAGYFWHEWQQSETVDRFLRRANQLEESGQYAKAIDYLDRYLRVRPDAPDKVDVRVRVAHAADRLANSPLRKQRTMELYRDAWDLDRSRIDLGIRKGDLAIELARFDEALRTADILETTALADPKSTAAAQAAGARLKALALLGRSDRPDVVVSADEWKSVVAAFQEAIRRNPSDVELPVRLADIYRHSLRQPAEAERQRLADDVMDALVKANRDRPQAWLARYLYRKSLQTAGEPTSGNADADLDQALEIGRRDPKKISADVLLYAGQRAADKKDRTAARRFFEQATTVRPTDHRGWVRLGELTAAEGTDAARTRAVEIWTKGLERVGRYEIDLVMPLTATLIQLRRFADADEKLRPLDAALPRLMEPGRSLVELGATRLRSGAAAAQGNYIAAAKLLQLVLNDTRAGTASATYRTPFADGWMQLGDYYSELKLDDRASDAYESAGRLDPKIPEWRSKAARAAERSGRAGDAIPHLRALADAEPGNPEKWLALARACLLDQIALAPAERNWQEFQSAFDRAVKTKANAVILAILNVDSNAAQDRLDRSAQILNQAVAKIPKAWELWQALAVVQQRRGANAEAIQALAAFEKIAPSRESVALLKARLAADAGRLDEACKTLEPALAAAPDAAKPLIRKQLVELELRQGRWQAARDRLEEEMKHDPQNLETLSALARVAADAGDAKGVAEVESRLRNLEGEDGTLWRECRARRLLTEVTEVDDPRFREADRLTREIAALRPAWAQRYVLQGVIARRQNQLDEAIAAYQQAVRLGNRNIGLSEELIDLLMERHRYVEADREFQRVRQAVARSSRLSSVAIPLFVRRGESEEAMRLAEDWVRRQPNDAAAFTRLARTVLLTTPENSPEYPKAVSRAQAAFEHAVALAPKDVRVWIALFRFYVGVQKNADAADGMLRRLAQRIDVPPAQKRFVLAQLYESIGRRSESARLYLEAIKAASGDAQTAVLERAAHFFVAEDPAQAASFCRQVLKRRPKSVDARRTLVRALAEEGTEESLREAAQLLSEIGRIGGNLAADRRMEAALLARTGRESDRQRSIELLEELVQIPQQAVSQDRILLASLQEKEHRLLPAYEQLRAVSRLEDASAADLVRYAEFLYRNVAEQPQFADYAEPVLARLESDPQNSVSAVRLRLESAKKLADPSARRAKTAQVVEQAAQRFVAKEKDAARRRATYSKLLILLVQEELADDAIRLVKDQCPCSDPVDAAVALADALTVLPADCKLAAQTASALAAAIDKSPRSVDLLCSVANLRYVRQSRDEAVALYRRALEIEPEHKLAMNNLALALADRPKDLPEALSIVDRAISKNATDAGLMDTKGQLLVLAGRAQEGAALLAKAASFQGADPIILLHLSNAYLAAGRTTEARSAYRRACALNVSASIVTPSDRAIFDRLEAHVHQTASAGG